MPHMNKEPNIGKASDTVMFSRSWTSQWDHNRIKLLYGGLAMAKQDRPEFAVQGLWIQLLADFSVNDWNSGPGGKMEARGEMEDVKVPLPHATLTYRLVCCERRAKVGRAAGQNAPLGRPPGICCFSLLSPAFLLLVVVLVEEKDGGGNQLLSQVAAEGGRRQGKAAASWGPSQECSLLQPTLPRFSSPMDRHIKNLWFFEIHWWSWNITPANFRGCIGKPGGFKSSWLYSFVVDGACSLL